MKTVRVLHIGLSNNRGGMERVVYSWLKYKPEWLKLDFINTCDQALAYEDSFRNAGGNIFHIVARRKNPLKSYMQLREIIKNGQYDYVHHHIMPMSWPEPCLIVNRLNSKTQAIIHAHTTLCNRQKVRRKDDILDLLGRKRLKKAKYHRVACGNDVGEHMFPGERFFLVKNGIDFDEFSFNALERRKIRAELGIGQTDIVLGHVGRSSYEKNYTFLLDFFRQLCDKYPNLKLLLIGDILDDSLVQERIDNLGVRERVICSGVVSSTAKYYSAMDVFVLPSFFEGVCLALLEAQASGLPCIASNFVAKETRISKRLDYISIDGFEEACAVFDRIIAEGTSLERRQHVVLDESYRLEHTAKQMFNFYLEHLTEE